MPTEASSLSFDLQLLRFAIDRWKQCEPFEFGTEMHKARVRDQQKGGHRKERSIDFYRIIYFVRFVSHLPIRCIAIQTRPHVAPDACTFFSYIFRVISFRMVSPLPMHTKYRLLMFGDAVMVSTRQSK